MTGTLRELLSEPLDRPVSGPKNAAAPFSIACNPKTSAHFQAHASCSGATCMYTVHEIIIMIDT